MQEFVHKLFIWSTIKFKCKHCRYSNEYGATINAHSHKTHKGKINGLGYGFNSQYGHNDVYLSFDLK